MGVAKRSFASSPPPSARSFFLRSWAAIRAVRSSTARRLHLARRYLARSAGDFNDARPPWARTVARTPSATSTGINAMAWIVAGSEAGVCEGDAESATQDAKGRATGP